MHRVVILGGGFGGMNAARGLKRAHAEVTLIDRRNYHQFQPLLYQVATGSLSPGDICAPLRPLFRGRENMSVLMGEVADIDVAGRRVILSDGEVPYDTLVVAAGSETSYFGHEQWERFAPPLKSIEDALEIRRRVLLAFEAAEREPDHAARSAWLTFVIIGGGPTGVELAGAFSEIANDTLVGDFRVIHPQDSRIFLVEASPRLLPHFSEKLSRRAEQDLVALGVRPLTGVRVTALEDGAVTLTWPDGRTHCISSRTLIWAAGVRPSSLGAALERGGAKLERGRVIVGPDCAVTGHPEIFVLGDLAHFTLADGKPLPGLAPVAIQQGQYVARVIRARLDNRARPGPFRYFDKGDLATIGRRRAVGRIWRFELEGVVAWVIWVFVHLMYLVGFQNRLLVFIQWAFYYVTFNRRARMITGPDPFPLVRGGGRGCDERKAA